MTACSLLIKRVCCDLSGFGVLLHLEATNGGLAIDNRLVGKVGFQCCQWKATLRNEVVGTAVWSGPSGCLSL